MLVNFEPYSLKNHVRRGARYRDHKSFTLFLAHFHTLKATHFGSYAARCLYSILMYMDRTYGALLKGLLNGIVKKMMKNRWKKRQNELQKRLTRWLPDISTDRQTPQLHRFHLFAFTIVKRHFILFFQIILARNIATNSH